MSLANGPRRRMFNFREKKLGLVTIKNCSNHKLQSEPNSLEANLSQSGHHSSSEEASTPKETDCESAIAQSSPR